MVKQTEKTEKIIRETIAKLIVKQSDLLNKGITITEFEAASRKLSEGITRPTIYNLLKKENSIINKFFRWEGKKLILNQGVDSLYVDQIKRLVDFYYGSTRGKTFPEACTSLSKLESEFNTQKGEVVMNFHEIFDQTLEWRRYFQYIVTDQEVLLAPDFEQMIVRKSDYDQNQRYCTYCFESIQGPCYVLHGEKWPDYIWDEINWDLYNFIHLHCFENMFKNLGYETYFLFQLETSPDNWDPAKHLCGECNLPIFEEDLRSRRVSPTEILTIMSDSVRIEFLEMVYELGDRNRKSTDQEEKSPEGEVENTEKSLLHYMAQFGDSTDSSEDTHDSTKLRLNDLTISLAITLKYMDQHPLEISPRQRALLKNYFLLKERVKRDHQKEYEQLEARIGPITAIPFTFQDNKYCAPVAVHDGRVYHVQCADRVMQRLQLVRNAEERS